MPMMVPLEVVLGKGDGGAAAHAGAPSPERYSTLALFFASSLLYSGSWICFAPVANLAAERFGLPSAGSMNGASMAYFAAYVPGTAISMSVLDAYGVRASLLGATAACTLCILVRYAALVVGPALSPRGAWTVNAAAYVIAGLFQPLVLNVPSRMTFDWFPAAERDIATTAATMASVSGQMLFSLLPPWLVQTPAQLPRVLLLLLMPSAAVTVITAARLSERPPVPPSAAAAAVWRERARAQAAGTGPLAAVVRDISQLLALPNFCALAASFSIGTGTVWSVLILQAQLLTPCGYSDELAGAAATALVASGLVASAAMGAAMRATRAYLQLQRGIMVAALLATLGVLAAARPGNPAAVMASWAALGATLPPLVPLTLEHAAEITFPIPADASNSALIVGATAFACVLTLALTPLLRLPTSVACSTVATPAAALVAACMAAGLVLALAVQPDNRRSAFEAAGGDDDDAAPVCAPLKHSRNTAAGAAVVVVKHGVAAHESDSLLRHAPGRHKPSGYEAML